MSCVGAVLTKIQGCVHSKVDEIRLGVNQPRGVLRKCRTPGTGHLQGMVLSFQLFVDSRSILRSNCPPMGLLVMGF